MKDNGDSHRARLSRRILVSLWDSAKRFKHAILSATALMIGAKLAALAVPVALKFLLDGFSQKPAGMILPIFLVLAYGALRFLGDALGELRDVVFSVVAQKTVAEFTERTFAQLHSLGARYHAKRETGTIIRDVERGGAAIGFLLGSALFAILPTLIEMGIVVAILTVGFSSDFAIVIVITFAVYACYTAILTRRRLRHQRVVNELEAKTDSRIVDSLLNHEVVKYFATENLERSRLAGVLSDWVQARISNQNALSVLHIGQSAIVASAICAVMLLTVRDVMLGRMTLGDLVLVNAYIVQVCMPLNMLGSVFREAQDAMVNIERMFGILDTPRLQGEDLDEANASPLRLSSGRIRFDDVFFAYDPSRPILCGINIEISAGETVAIVGGSGSGKSTLMRLLFRLYQPTSGRVLIDDQDIHSLTQQSLRESIGIVPQDTVLFNETIAYNIGYGNPAATRAEVVRAARAAQLDQFVENLPDHYETRVGERGVRLSGGERQRIAIARAILKNPPIIVFDEATSALDVRTERAIQAELDQLSKGRTSIVIAHRLATVVGADRILVMEHGKVVEEGTHDALLARDGVYAKMWALQRQQGELARAQSRLVLQTARLGAMIDGVLDLLHDTFATYSPDFYTICSDADRTVRVVGDIGALQRAITELCQHEIVAANRGERIELRADHQGQHALIGIYRRPDTPAYLSDMDATHLEHDLTAANAGLTLTSRNGRIGYAVTVPTQAAQVQAATGPTSVPSDAWFAAPSPLASLTLNDPNSNNRAIDRNFLADIGDGPIKRSEASALAGVRIFLIDDEAPVREAMTAALEASGAAVSSYAQGQQALDFLEDSTSDAWPDILLCDIVLADGEDGYTVLRLLRQLEERRQLPLEDRVPALAITGQTQPEDRVRTLGAGFQSHLGKPVSMSRLIATINLFVRR